MNLSMNELIHPSMNQTIDWSIDQPINQASNQSINHIYQTPFSPSKQMKNRVVYCLTSMHQDLVRDHFIHCNRCMFNLVFIQMWIRYDIYPIPQGVISVGPTIMLVESLVRFQHDVLKIDTIRITKWLCLNPETLLL